MSNEDKRPDHASKPATDDTNSPPANAAGNGAHSSSDDLLREFLNGTMLAKIPLGHKEAIGILNELDTHLAPDQERVAESGRVPVGYFLQTLGKQFQLLESAEIQNYGKSLEQLVKHGLDPVRTALKGMTSIFEEAEARKNERDPKIRREMAEKLRKVPSAIHFINAQLLEMVETFNGNIDRFFNECEYRSALQGGQLSEIQEEDRQYMKENAPHIKQAFETCTSPIMDYCTNIRRLQARAQELEKRFMAPPSAQTSIQVG